MLVTGAWMATSPSMPRSDAVVTKLVGSARKTCPARMRIFPPCPAKALHAYGLFRSDHNVATTTSALSRTVDLGTMYEGHLPRLYDNISRTATATLAKRVRGRKNLAGIQHQNGCRDKNSPGIPRAIARCVAQDAMMYDDGFPCSDSHWSCRT